MAFRRKLVPIGQLLVFLSDHLGVVGATRYLSGILTIFLFIIKGFIISDVLLSLIIIIFINIILRIVSFVISLLWSIETTTHVIVAGLFVIDLTVSSLAALLPLANRLLLVAFKVVVSASRARLRDVKI